MSRHPSRPHLLAAGAGALLAALVALMGAAPGSAAHLQVDGGILQTFTFPGPEHTTDTEQ